MISVDGRLVGALTGRTDVLTRQGGDGAFIGLDQIAEFVRSQISSRPRRRPGRTIDPQPAPGRFFIVYGLFGEKLD